MYNYLNDNILTKELRDNCEEMLLNVQKELTDFFSFDFRIFGCGESRLLVKKDDVNNFDMEYSIILQKDKQGLFSDPNRIVEVFKEAFAKLYPDVNFTYFKQSDIAIEAKFIDMESEYSYNFRVSFLLERFKRNYLKIVYSYDFESYIWQEEVNTKDYQTRFKAVKSQGEWIKFKEAYLVNKNREPLDTKCGNAFKTFMCVLNQIKGDSK